MTNNIQKAQIVIGLVGPKRSGKDTIADLSIAKMDASGKIANATFLKTMCNQCLKLKPEFFDTLKDESFKRPFILKGNHVRSILNEMDRVLPAHIKKQNNLKLHKIGVQKYCDRPFTTPRQILQFIGTELIQSIYKPFHSVVAYNEILGKPGVWFVTDLRFKHEEIYAKEVFPLFYPILVHRPTNIQDSTHVSENEWKTIETFATITNDCSLDVLEQRCADVFKLIQDDVKNRINSLTPEDWKKMTCPPSIDDSRYNQGEIAGKSDNPNIKFIYQRPRDIVDRGPRDL